jgi:threonine dehydrogenase-like Zn-dependent dehydrogenase
VSDAPRGDRRSAVVLGAGPVGLLGAMAFAAQGFDTYVYSRSSNPTSAEVVREIGGTFISSETHRIAEMADKVGRIDVVYEAVGASQLAFEVVRHLGPNGVFIFIGVPGRRGPVCLDPDRIMRNIVLDNQILLGSVNAGRDAFAGAIKDLGVFMERWPGAVRKLLTGRFKPEDHMTLLTGKPGGIKNIVSFAE